MKKLLLLGCLLAAGAGLKAVETPADEARRVDTNVYSTETPALTNGGAVQALSADRAVAPADISPIADLKAAHLAEYRALEQALAGARDTAERQSLELRAVEMKREHQRAELEALKADALLRHDAAYAARLDEALGQLTPAPAPVATTFVPRDVTTGRALDPAVEGGTK